MKKLIAAMTALMILVCGCTAAFADVNSVTKEEAMKIALPTMLYIVGTLVAFSCRKRRDQI